MTKRIVAVILVMLSFMVAFISIGYASLSHELKINSTVSIPALPNEVIITDVELVGAVSSGESVRMLDIWPTNLSTDIKGSAGDTVTYKITVKNYSDYKYSYIGVKYDENTDNNNLYGTGFTVTVKKEANDTTDTFGAGTVIEAMDTVDQNGNALDTLTFYATYTIKSGSDVTIRSFINYEFGVHADDAGIAAVDGALSQFDRILNTPSSYNTLMTLYNSNVNDRYREDHVGNVATSWVAGLFTNDDETILNLFGDKLVLGDVEVKTLIKRLDVDGKTGNEMLIFLTPTDIMGMGISNSRTYIPDVYCAVFTNSQYTEGEPSGVWYQIGDLYSGKAYGLRYTTGLAPSGFFNADCIDYDTWVSTGDTFEPCDEYKYTVKANKGIGDIVKASSGSVTQNSTSNTTQALTALLEDAAKVRAEGFTGSGWNNFLETMERLKTVHRAYTEDASGNLTVSSGMTHAQAVSAIGELDAALTPFRAWLDG